MKNKIFVYILFVLFITQAYANESNRNQTSSVPSTVQFEIIQSELTAKITLKIDKFSGNVFQLVTGKEGLTWQLISKEKHSKDKAFSSKVNYQLFTSGLAVRLTFLINVNTGATWQLAEDNEIGAFWKALE